jgi:phosphate transport system substrate-binding protein
MLRRIRAAVIAGALAALASLPASGQQQPPPPGEPDVRIAGTLSTKPLLTTAVRALKQQKDLLIAVSAGLTSADALDALAQGQADIAIVTRPLTGQDRAKYPSLDFDTVPIGMEVVALGIANDLWQAGVRALTKKQLRAIYEQKITNWKDTGGPDEKITFFNFEQGAGVWEIFAQWLYGDNLKAPLPKFEKVANNQDARDDLEFTPGSMAPIDVSFVDGTRCHALGLQFLDHIVTPTPDQVAAGHYPMTRPILAITIGRPTLSIRAVTDFLTGPSGQALLKSAGNMGVDTVPTPAPTPGH